MRTRTYSSIPGTVLRQEPKSRHATGAATRVLQRDPIGYAGGINVYEYVGGRPVTAVDPSGTVEFYVTHEGIQIGHPKWSLKTPFGKIPACPRGVQGCCASVVFSYKAFLGTITSSGSRATIGHGLLGEIAGAVVKGVASLVPETKLVSLWTDNITLNGVLYIWDMYATYDRTFTYSYCCGTNYQGLKPVSATTSNLNIDVVAANRSEDDPNNVDFSGTTRQSKKRAIESIWEALHELTTTLGGD